ncbi:MAG: hypothetical protein AAF253_06790 [Pseudomonadota bacterium]
MANSNGQDVLLEDLATEVGPVSQLEVSEDSSDLITLGDAEDNVLTGDINDNQIDAGGGGDLILGNAGDDILLGGDGDDTINGGIDNDLLFGNRGADILNGGSGNDDLRGGGGDDILRGHTGNDTLNGGGGDDRLIGGRGSDTLFGNVGNDNLNGGSGVDTAVFVGNFDEYTVAVTASGGSVTKTSGNAPDEGIDTFLNVEILQFADQRVLIVGADGFDTIQEAVDASADGDIIQIAAGTYTEQVFITNKEGLTLIGEGAGTVIEAPVALQVNAAGLPAPGEDVDAAGVVSVLDSRDISIENLTIDGDDAGDAIVTTGVPYFVGLLFVDSSGGADGVTVQNVRNPLEGGLPTDARTGDGVAIYNTDTLSRDVSVTNSTIFDFQKTGIRANGEDLAVTLEGNTIEGAGLLSAPDALIQLGITIENGAAGVVEGNTIGGIGTLRGDVPTAGVLVEQGADRLQIIGNTFEGVGSPNTHTGVIIDGESDFTRVEDNTFNGILNGVAALNNVDGINISGGIFVDMIESVATSTGGSRPGLFTALSGDDNDGFDPMVRFDGTEGSDLVEGSSVRDIIETGGGNDRIDAGGGNDRAKGGAGDDTVNGNGGDDVVVGNAGSDLLTGGGGDDTVRGGGGNDQLNGGRGEDILIGGGGDDLLNGGAGDDTLNGGVGDDLLRGQGGEDTYIFDADDAGSDTVEGFEAGETVQLDGFGFASVAAAETAFVQVGDDVVFTAGSVEVTFVDVDRADVIAGIEIPSSASSSASFDFSRVDAAPAAAVEPVDEGDAAPAAPATDLPSLEDIADDVFADADDAFADMV